MDTKRFERYLSRPQYRGIKNRSLVAKAMKSKTCVYCHRRFSNKRKRLIEHMHQHAQRSQGDLKKPPNTQGSFRGAACFRCNAMERESLKSLLKSRGFTTDSFKERFFSPRFFLSQARRMKVKYSPYKNTSLNYLKDVLDGTVAEDIVKELKF